MIKKKLEIHRGASLFPLKLDNGDIYDSSAYLLINNVWIWSSCLVNTDFTNGYKGGILSKGVYNGIKFRRKNGENAIALYQKKFTINHYNDLTEEMVILESDIPNPNHNGNKIITHVLVHSGGLTWDYSHGCITILNRSHYNEFDKLMEFIEMDEVIEVDLR